MRTAINIIGLAVLAGGFILGAVYGNGLVSFPMIAAAVGILGTVNEIEIQ